MRKLAVLLFISIGMMSTAKAEINFQNLTLYKGLQKAKKENKPLFIDVYATWCGPCKMLSNSTFKDADLGKFMNEHFISIKVDGETEDGEALMAQFELDAYPTMIILDGDMKLQDKIVGFVGAESVMEIAEGVVFPESTELFKLGQRFDAGEREKEFLLEFIELKMDKEKDLTSLIETYLELYPELDLSQRGEFVVFCGMDHNLNAPYVSNFLNDAEAIGQLHRDLAEFKFVQILLTMVEDAQLKNDESIVIEGLDQVYPSYVAIVEDAAYEKTELLEILMELYNEE